MDQHRFRFVSSRQIERRIRDSVPHNTQKNTVWAVNTWNAWAVARNSARILGQPKVPLATDLRVINAEDLNNHLCHFVFEVRNKEGNMYPKDTLYNVCAGLSRYVKETMKRPDLNFLNVNNLSFLRFRKALDAQMKFASEQSDGIGIYKNPVRTISAEQEAVLWEKGILSVDSAYGLSRAVYFYNCKVFGLKGRVEHRNLKMNQYYFGSDECGKYIKFRNGNCENGGLYKRKAKMKDIKHYDTGKSLSVYKIFIMYFKKVGLLDDFYLKPLPALFPGDIRFSSKPVGMNALATYINDMMKEAGYIGSFTTRPSKETSAIRLFHKDTDEQQKNGLTEHLSLVHNATDKQQRNGLTEHLSLVHKDTDGQQRTGLIEHLSLVHIDTDKQQRNGAEQLSLIYKETDKQQKISLTEHIPLVHKDTNDQQRNSFTDHSSDAVNTYEKATSEKQNSVRKMIDIPEHVANKPTASNDVILPHNFSLRQVPESGENYSSRLDSKLKRSSDISLEFHSKMPRLEESATETVTHNNIIELNKDVCLDLSNNNNEDQNVSQTAKLCKGGKTDSSCQTDDRSVLDKETQTETCDGYIHKKFAIKIHGISNFDPGYSFQE